MHPLGCKIALPPLPKGEGLPRYEFLCKLIEKAQTAKRHNSSLKIKSCISFYLILINDVSCIRRHIIFSRSRL
jgi:hypothetical protein